MPAQLSLTTDPGLEGLALDELRARVGPATAFAGEVCPDGRAGHLAVTAELPQEELQQLALQLCSVHHLVRPVLRFALAPTDPLDHLRRTVAGIAGSIPELLPEAVTFRVTASRSGTHPFTSEEVARVAGAGRSVRTAPRADPNHHRDAPGTRRRRGARGTRDAGARWHQLARLSSARTRRGPCGA